MTIAHKHESLSAAAGTWLLRAINPFAVKAEVVEAPNAADVPRLLKAGELHGVLPQVLRSLKSCRERTPDGSWVKGTTAETEQANAAIRSAETLLLHQTGSQLLLVHHAEKILASLKGAGAGASIVKGPVFARRLYPTSALRMFTDVDVLIAPSDRDLVKRLMDRLGFELAEEAYRGQEDYFEDKYVLAKNPHVLIEVHSNLVHNPRMRRSASVSLSDVTRAGDGDCEDATALLFVAAAHGAISHQFDRLQHVLDIALAASGAAGPVDADRLRRVSEDCGVLTPVYAALTLAARMFPHPALPLIASQLRPSFWARLAGRLVTPDVVLGARSEGRSSSSWRRKALRQLIVRTGRKQDRQELLRI